MEHKDAYLWSTSSWPQMKMEPKKKVEVFDMMNLAIIFVEHSEPQLNMIVILLS